MFGLLFPYFFAKGTEGYLKKKKSECHIYMHNSVIKQWKTSWMMEKELEIQKHTFLFVDKIYSPDRFQYQFFFFWKAVLWGEKCSSATEQ